MTQSEAIRQIEHWLKVPIDFDAVLPALAVLRHTSEFEDYVNRVAEAEFKTPEDIILDIDVYMSKSSERSEEMAALEKKLEALSGKTRKLQKELSFRSADVLDKLAQQRRPKSEADMREDALKAYMSKSRYQGRSQSAMVPQCQYCQSALVTKEVAKIQTIGWVLFFLMFFTFPLSMIPLLVFREKHTKYYCPHCRRDA